MGKGSIGVGYGLLVIGCWSLVIGNWLLHDRFRPLTFGATRPAPENDTTHYVSTRDSVLASESSPKGWKASGAGGR